MRAVGDADGGEGMERRGDAVLRARGRAALVAVPQPPPARRTPIAPVPPSPELIAALAAAGSDVRLGEPLGPHTSFRIGGPADVFIEVASVPELAAVLRACAAHTTP